jgi:ribosome maturation factor RimP
LVVSFLTLTFRSSVALQQIVQETVTGLGYDLVEIDRTAGGLLRITIDWPWQPGSDLFINVEDCEKVNRQLQFALEVDGVTYNRLEVSSPGIDRPLRNESDFERFVGELIDITLKQPMGDSAAGMVNPTRKKFRGTLERDATGQGWQIVWSDAPAVKPGQKISKKADPCAFARVGFHARRVARCAPRTRGGLQRAQAQARSLTAAPIF